MSRHKIANSKLNINSEQVVLIRKHEWETIFIKCYNWVLNQYKLKQKRQTQMKMERANINASVNESTYLISSKIHQNCVYKFAEMENYCNPNANASILSGILWILKFWILIKSRSEFPFQLLINAPNEIIPRRYTVYTYYTPTAMFIYLVKKQEED